MSRYVQARGVVMGVGARVAARDVLSVSLQWRSMSHEVFAN